MTEVKAGEETGTTIRSVSFVVFDLRFDEPGGVLVPGEADRDAESERDRAHLVLDTGPDGTVRLPGTSVAGSLRAMIAAERDPDVADDLFGRLLDPGEPGSREDVDAVASRIWVLGTRRKDTAPTVFRTSTAVDRHRAAAKENTLRGEELLPAGSEFEVFLRWDNASEDEVRELAETVAAWRPFIGRGTSRGRGACTARAVGYGTLRLDEPTGLARWLASSGPELACEVATDSVREPEASSGREPVLRVQVELDGPFRTGNGVKPEKDSGQPVPLFRVGGKPVVPGSSLKGLLRARAEFILRTVGIDACLDQRCPADGACWTCRVFGRGGGQDEEADSVGARSLLRIPDAVIEDATCAERVHVAIDRFTGGGLEHALYTDEVLEAGRFELRVDSFAAPGTLDPPVREIRAVLRLVLQDLADGIIGLGSGVARGYGTVKVTGLDTLPTITEARTVLREMAGR